MRFAVLTIVVVLVVSVFGLGAAMLDNDFVLDAEKIVQGREVLTSGGLAEIVSSPWWPADEVEQRLHRPATLLLYALVARLGAGTDDAGPYNTVNLVLHLLNALARFALVSYLLRGRRLRDMAAFAAALIPAVHALSFESVVGIVGAAELLAALFMTLSWIVFALGWERRGPANGALFCFLAAFLWMVALLAKETAALFPLVPIFHVLLLRPERRAARAVLVLTLVLAGLAGLGALTMRRQAIGSLGLDAGKAVHVGFDTGERVASSLAVLGSRYLPELVWPRRLEPNIGHQDVPPPTGFGDSRVLIGLAVWLVLLIWLVRATRAGRPEALFLLFAILSYLPTSNLVVPIGAVGAWRFLYSPLFGLVAALVLETERAFRLRAIRRFSLVAGLAVVTLFGALGTPSLLRMWRDGETLYRTALEINPNSIWALHNLATVRHLDGRGPTDFKALIEELSAFNAMEDDLAELPDGSGIDRPSREIAFRLLMNLAAAQGHVAQSLDDAARAANAANVGVRSALRAETYIWDDAPKAFDARLRAFRLRQLEILLLRRMPERDGAAEDFTIQQAESDLRALDGYPAKDLGAPRRIALGLAAAQYGELVGDRRLALRYLDRAAEIDATDPDLASLRARMAQAAGKAADALACLEPVFAAERARIDQHALAAQLLQSLGRARDARVHRLAILDLEPTNPVEARIKEEVLREFGIGAEGGR